MIMSDVNDDTLAEMDTLVAEGVPDFKLFTAYPGVFYSDDGAIFRAMQQTGKNGGLIMMHAENGLAIDIVAADLVADGKTDPLLPRHRALPDLRGRGDQPRHPAGRGRAGARCTSSTSRRATRSTPSATRATAGSQAFAETCPQYLFLSLDDMGNGFEGAKFVCSPPLRTADHQDELWTRPRQGRPPGRLDRPLPVRLPRPEGPRQGRLPEGPERPAGRRGPGRPAPRRRRRRRAGSRRSAGSRSSRPRPAKLFGMYPRKGAVAVGADADLVVYDPNRKRTISAKTHHMDVDYSCYEGRRVQGGSDVVLSRGSVVVRDGEFTGRKGAGQVHQARDRRLRPDGLTAVARAPEVARTPPRRLRRRPARRGAGVRARGGGRASAARRGVADDLVQAVDEATCNVMLHGYGGSRARSRSRRALRDGRIEIRLLDRAPPFDPTAAPAQDTSTPPVSKRPGGMGVGIHLLRTMTDEVRHHVRPDGGNELTLVRSIDDPAQED